MRWIWLYAFILSWAWYDTSTFLLQTPRQNGVVEWWHVPNIAQALWFQSHISFTFWGECVLTATYLINLLPTPLISKKTPFEKLYNWTPTFGHLHVLEEIYFKYSWWYGTSCCSSVTFPMEQNLKLAPTERDVFNNSSQYRRLVMRLIYLTITPPNICYLV